jgi:3-oxo-4,17-pregnadiene-20-carboxyl-CoA hydratase beta subunit
MKVGVELPEFSLPLTMQRLVMEAAANRDFTPIHHDRELTRATGAPDPYANTMLIQSVLEATLREWMGLAGQLRTLRFTMRAFATVGTIMSGHGRVTAIRAEQGGQFVDLDVWTDSDGSQTATGSATVWLPSQGAQP